MKVSINLASEPFRRDRPLIIGSVVVGVLLTIMFAVLTFVSISERNRASQARQSIVLMEKQLAAYSQEQSRLDGTLRQPKNAEVLERSLFLNALLLRKGVSWTRIFEDLEKVTPPSVRLISVRPQISPNNELMLDMVVGTQTSEPFITFVSALERSNVFSLPTVHNSQPPSQTDPLFKYRISVNYAQKL